MIYSEYDNTRHHTYYSALTNKPAFNEVIQVNCTVIFRKKVSKIKSNIQNIFLIVADKYLFQIVYRMGCGASSVEEYAIIRSKQIDEELKKCNKESSAIVKILLLGSGESGKSTLVKQMRVIHGNGYTPG